MARVGDTKIHYKSLERFANSKDSVNEDNALDKKYKKPQWLV
jgi:hypothetical protein